MATKVTAHNTGLAITREGSRFTAEWKIKTLEDKVKTQKLRYRTYNGKKWSAWTTKTLAKDTTSYSFRLDASKTIKQVQVQTQIATSTAGYKASAWTSSSAVFKLSPPPAPVLTTTPDNSNTTTFTWEENYDDNNAKWYYHCYYRTKRDTKPDATTGWGAWTQATSYNYQYVDNVQGQTRAFQIRAKGPAGFSAIRSGRHYLGTAPVAQWDKGVTLAKYSGYYKLTYSVTLSFYTNATDEVVPQWYIGKPAASMAPDSPSWDDGSAFSYNSKYKNYTLSATTDRYIGEDECLWARVKTTHDGVESFSSVKRVLTGVLAKPTLVISMSTPTSAGFTVDITVTDTGTDVPGAYMQVYLEKASKTGEKNYIKIGTVPNGAATASITSNINLTTETGYAIHVRNVTADGKSMTSGYVSYKTTMPSAPTLSSVEATTTSGKVYLSWVNNWSQATGVIIAWTDDPDNWTSNEDPETYEIAEVASNWFITGLETGKMWYFRVRSVKTVGESDTFSPWSEDVSINLASAPAVPVLQLSAEAITEDGMVTAYWSHVSTDGTGQIAADIVEATYTGGVWTYGDPVGAAMEEQHIDIYAADQGWTNGTTVYLALQTRSGSGGVSGYSAPVQLVIAEKPTATITGTSFDSTETLTEHFLGDGTTTTFLCAHNMTAAPTATVDDMAAPVVSYTGGEVVLQSAPADGKDVSITYTTADNHVLSAMPLTVDVTTTSAATLTTAIERATTYPMVRPDGTRTDGPEGETIFVSTASADPTQTVTIDMPNLIGRLDDGAWYRLVVTASDSFGQSDTKAELFRVHWAHQSWMPEATFETDATNYIAKITPVAGEDYVSGDKCSIYRLGADAPELIVENGEFGTQYVDPFPAFGALSGYKVVTVTATEDYITEGNGFAEYDTTVVTPAVYTQLDPGTLVIDFGGDRVELGYNIDLGNTWAKDFKRTTYLGGHVTGDHNKAVTRDLSTSSVLVKADNDIMATKMRELARYTGLCHVRTPEGSSFTADVQVAESMSFDLATISYSLTIQRVDRVGLDGMTYAEWSEMQ